MLNRSSLSLLIFLLFAQYASAQASRSLNTSFINQEAPVAFTAYDATLRTFEEGFMAVEYLEEVIRLKNVTGDRVMAFEIGIVYTDAFGDEIDRVRETRIEEVKANEPFEDAFRSPLVYDIPVYSAVAYLNRLRLEPAEGQSGFILWQADSSNVESELKRLHNEVRRAAGEE